MRHVFREVRTSKNGLPFSKMTPGSVEILIQLTRMLKLRPPTATNCPILGVNMHAVGEYNSEIRGNWELWRATQHPHFGSRGESRGHIGESFETKWAGTSVHLYCCSLIGRLLSPAMLQQPASALHTSGPSLASAQPVKAALVRGGQDPRGSPRLSVQWINPIKPKIRLVSVP